MIRQVAKLGQKEDCDFVKIKNKKLQTRIKNDTIKRDISKTKKIFI